MASITYQATKDAIMGKNVSGGGGASWNGKDDHLWVGIGASGNNKVRAVTYFPINFSVMTSITSATLTLRRHNPDTHTAAGGGTTTVITASRMTADWGEGTNVGEGVYSTSQSWDWDSRSDKFTTANQVDIGSDGGVSNASVSDLHAETWDVTGIVTDWFNGSSNYGLILVNANEVNINRGREYYSCQTAHAPSLTIVYVVNAPPSAPVNLFPTGDQIVNSLIPTFVGSSDDEDGDYITGQQVKVYNDSASLDGDPTIYNSGFIARTGKPTTFSVDYGDNAASVPNLVGNTFYKWAARTWDKAGYVGPFSSLQRFKINQTPNAPTLTIIDTPSGAIPTLTPQFQVTHNDPDPADTKMYGYEVIVEENSATDGSGSWSTFWDSGQADTSGSPVTSKTITSASLPDWGGYYRVKARTKDANGAWSQYCGTKQFSTYKTLPPINLQPTVGDSSSQTPTFTGDRASTTDLLTSYEIVVYSDSLGTTEWSSGTLTTGLSPDNVNGVSFAKLCGTTLTGGVFHQWKVRVTSSVGGTSDWSDLQRFFALDATSPTLVMPTTNDGTRVTTLTPAIVGSRATTFNRFKYEIFTDAAGLVLLNASSVLSTTIGAGGLGTQFTSAAYGGTALAWNTSYYVHAAVSSDGGSTWTGWTGLFKFTTDLAQTPTLTTPAAGAWIASNTPSFTITRGGGDTIDKIEVRVWTAAVSPVLVWDSGVVDVANATTGSLTYSGPTLTPGDYKWDARYQKTTGPFGNYAALQSFRVNAAPDTPSDLFPTPSYVFPDTLLPVFQAIFSDDDVEVRGDTPSAWDIIVQLADGTPVAGKHITTSLVVGLNEYDWTIGDTTLSSGTDYRFMTRFFDSLGAAGPYSGFNAFKMAASPNATITAPTDASNINVVTPTITWSYSGGTQQSFGMAVDLTDAHGAVLVRVANYHRTSAATSFTIPDTGVFKNDHYYTITLTATNTDGLIDPSPSSVNVYVALDAPDPIVGLSPTITPELSLVQLNWNTTTVKSGHTFVAYNIYRRLRGDIDFVFVDSIGPLGHSYYNDYYAGNELDYDYRVTSTATKSGVGIELESPDDPDGGNVCFITMDADTWMLVGADRDPEHILELPVTDESHQRVIQQEAFETLGANRKVIIRGFVLGSEGSITCIWRHELVESPTDPQVFYDETVVGRRLLDYLVSHKGPHILKSPFGDVWDIEVEGPSYQWMKGGNLEVQMNWTETGPPHGVNV